MTRESDQARIKVLTENTAQAVHKHLDKIFGEESRFRSRWVWELLQNARDASPSQGVKVWIYSAPDRLIFRHDGLPFTNEDVAHLIYHGSTKHDLSDGAPIGQFGSGFLTTHLLSRVVMVKGWTVEDESFSFKLDRNGKTAAELQEAMDRSWNAYDASLGKECTGLPDGHTTEYYYPVFGRIAEVVQCGLDALEANIGYVMAFNPRIASVRITRPDRDVVFKSVEKQTISESIARIHIEASLGTARPDDRFIVVCKEGKTSIAAEVVPSGLSWNVAIDSVTPRIFVAFPLTGTIGFPLPVIVNSEAFEPREDRDSVYLRENPDGNPNLGLLQQAIDLAGRLALHAAEAGWDRSALLARLGELKEADWIDGEWFRSVVKSSFVELLRNTEVLFASYSGVTGGGRIAPASSLIPFSRDNVVQEEIWKLMTLWEGGPSSLPRLEESALWAEILESWASLLQCSAEDFEEALTLERLCELAEGCGELVRVEKMLREGCPAIKWLNDLHATIQKAGKNDLFDKMSLVPNQRGEFRKIGRLRSDPGIDEGLKEIAESLGCSILSELVDTRFALNASPDLQPRTQEDVLEDALDKVKKAAKDGALEEYRGANIHLFSWLVRNGQLDFLENYPVLSRLGTDGKVVTITLRQSGDGEGEFVLAPIGCWPKSVQEVADLFSREQTLSEDYFQKVDDAFFWKRVEEEGYVRLSPLFQTRKQVLFLPDEPLPIAEKNERHRTKEAVEVTALAFLEKEGAGVDVVRKSKKRARMLLRFLAEYALEADPSLATLEAECECGGNHRYYHASWLSVLWDRPWVPLGDNKQGRATAETIAQLYDGREDELRELTSGRGRDLLSALKVSLADLTFRAVAKDEETRLSLIGSLSDIVQAAQHDTEKVRLLAEAVKESPELLESLRQHQENLVKIRRNQKIGLLVEQILEEALRHEGFNVKRTGIGSDYEIENDSVEGGEEILLTLERGTRSILVEIKTTISGFAPRMTLTQAATAVENRNRFALCVVQHASTEEDITPEAVREGCRFVTGIGSYVDPALKKFRQFEDARKTACEKEGGVDLVMTNSEVRFAVNSILCESGLRFEDAMKFFKASFVPDPETPLTPHSASPLRPPTPLH